MTKIPNDLNKVLYRSYSTCSNLKKHIKTQIKEGWLILYLNFVTSFLMLKNTSLMLYSLHMV